MWNFSNFMKNNFNLYVPNSKPISYYERMHKIIRKEQGNEYLGDELEFIIIEQLESFFKNNKIKYPYKIIHNAYIPNGDLYAEIDIILITEYGIYVIESKNYSGWIYGSLNSNYWLQSLSKENKNSFYNPLKQNYNHRNILSYYILEDYRNMKSIIYFGEECELKKIPTQEQLDSINSAIVTDYRSLIDEIIKFGKNKIITLERVEEIYNKLLPTTKLSEEEKEKNKEKIKNIYNQNKNT